MTAREIFARNLREQRLSRKLSQEDLGHLSDLNMSEISRLERCTRDPRLATIVKLANALEVPPASLLADIP